MGQDSFQNGEISVFAMITYFSFIFNRGSHKYSCNFRIFCMPHTVRMQIGMKKAPPLDNCWKLLWKTFHDISATFHYMGVVSSLLLC